MWNSNKNSQNVVEMSPFLTDKRFPEISELDSYWSALCRGRSMPSRADVDPRGIEGALSHTFILERIAPGITRLRLAGHHLNDLMGMEVRGMPLSTFFAAHHRKTVETLSEHVCTGPAKAEFQLSAERGLGKPAIEARMTLWPLADAQGYATRLLGGLSFQGHIGRAPRRFMVASSRLIKLTAEQPAQPLPRQPVAGFAEPRRRFETAKPVEASKHAQHGGRDGAEHLSHRPYLRLIKSE
ncbi:MAG: PAS domain-containing protein [Thalassovita sp.]